MYVFLVTSMSLQLHDIGYGLHDVKCFDGVLELTDLDLGVVEQLLNIESLNAGGGLLGGDASFQLVEDAQHVLGGAGLGVGLLLLLKIGGE